MTQSALILTAYLLGSLSSAIIVCRLLGLPDPRTVGSHNPGATNVLRFGGKKAAALTLVGDMLKGVLPVLAGRALDMDMLWLTLIGFSAFIGHLYPLFFGFSGGKGVATALGVYLAVYPPLGLAVAAIWLLVAKLLRLSSLSALVATALSPLIAWGLSFPTGAIAVIMVLTIMLWWRHRSNIRKLISGEEGRISATKDSDEPEG